jgi:hypothetical protein
MPTGEINKMKLAPSILRSKFRMKTGKIAKEMVRRSGEEVVKIPIGIGNIKRICAIRNLVKFSKPEITLVAGLFKLSMLSIALRQRCGDAERLIVVNGEQHSYSLPDIVLRLDALSSSSFKLPKLFSAGSWSGGISRYAKR